MTFEEVCKINVNDKTEKKNGLTYLSWAWAWAEFKKIYPDAQYSIEQFDGLPYVYDVNTGYMVFTSVTAGDLTYKMWLPVMDSNNKAMKSAPYEVKTKYKTLTVEPATMFDVNKAIMRCLVKNLAMFGLGLYIYAGEDLPEGDEQPEPQNEPVADPLVNEDNLNLLLGLAKEKGVSAEDIRVTYKLNDIHELTMRMWVHATKMLENMPAKE